MHQTAEWGMSICCSVCSSQSRGHTLAVVWAKGLLKSLDAVAAGQALHISDLPRSSTSETMILRLRMYTGQAINA